MYSLLANPVGSVFKICPEFDCSHHTLFQILWKKPLWSLTEVIAVVFSLMSLMLLLPPYQPQAIFSAAPRVIWLEKYKSTYHFFAHNQWLPIFFRMKVPTLTTSPYVFTTYLSDLISYLFSTGSPCSSHTFSPKRVFEFLLCAGALFLLCPYFLQLFHQESPSKWNLLWSLCIFPNPNISLSPYLPLFFIP